MDKKMWITWGGVWVEGLERKEGLGESYACLTRGSTIERSEGL